MENHLKKCQNPLCTNPGAIEVPVSVTRYADKVRTLCVSCEEVYAWGIQQGKMLIRQIPLWIVVVADSGIIGHVAAYNDQQVAVKDLADYLKEYHGYKGTAELNVIYQWLRQNDETLSTEIICQDGIDPKARHVKSQTDNVARFINDHDFIVIGKNICDPDPVTPFEAWAYKGPLDFKIATAITWGRGSSYLDALEALGCRLGQVFGNDLQPGKNLRSKPHKTFPQVKCRCSRRWKCPNCRHIIEWSYEQLVEAGSPCCPRCENEMNLIGDTKTRQANDIPPHDQVEELIGAARRVVDDWPSSNLAESVRELDRVLKELETKQE